MYSKNCVYRYVHILTLVNPVTLGTMQLGQNSEVAADQEIAALKNDLTSNLITTFAVLVSRIM